MTWGRSLAIGEKAPPVFSSVRTACRSNSTSRRRYPSTLALAMLAAYTACRSAHTSMARAMISVVGDASNMLRFPSLLNDQFGVQSARPFDSLENGDDVAGARANRLQRVDQLCDGRALRQAHGLQLRFGDIDGGFRNDSRARAGTRFEDERFGLRHQEALRDGDTNVALGH